VSVIVFVENEANWSLKISVLPGIVNVLGRKTVPARVLESMKIAWTFVETLKAIPTS
jgi:hypothetical protein